MQVFGTGVDIIEISRLEYAMKRFPRLKARLFSEREREEARCARERETVLLAGRFAAKEAVAKALGRSCAWHEVEIIRGGLGRPRVILHGRAERAGEGIRVMVSISHCRQYAVASAVAVAGDRR